MIEFFWDFVPVWAQWGLVACAVLFVVGTIWRIKDVLVLIQRVAGWPVVAAIIGAIGIVAAVVWGLFTGRRPPASNSSPRWPRGRSAKRTLPVPKSLSESN